MPAGKSFTVTLPPCDTAFVLPVRHGKLRQPSPARVTAMDEYSVHDWLVFSGIRHDKAWDCIGRCSAEPDWSGFPVFRHVHIFTDDQITLWLALYGYDRSRWPAQVKHPFREPGMLFGMGYRLDHGHYSKHEPQPEVY